MIAGSALASAPITPVKAGHVVARKDRSQVARRHGIGQRRLLDRQKEADVAGRGIERADNGDNEKRPEGGDGREADAGREHQGAGREQHASAAESMSRQPDP
jgi:hypothetical protein